MQQSFKWVERFAGYDASVAVKVDLVFCAIVKSTTDQSSPDDLFLLILIF